MKLRKATPFSRTPELESPGVWEGSPFCKPIAALQTLLSLRLTSHQDMPSLLTEHMSLEDIEAAFKCPFMTSKLYNFK